MVADFHVQAMEGDHALGREADDGVAAETLAAFHRFQQVGVRGVGEFQVDREWRVQVGQHFAHHGHAGVGRGRRELLSVLLEWGVRGQNGFPSDAQGSGGRRRQATIASGERKEGRGSASA